MKENKTLNATVTTLRQVNQSLTGKHVAPIFMAHFVDTRKGLFGVAPLIMDILIQSGANFTSDFANNPENRAEVLAKSMLSDDIISAVEKRFSAGTSRYPVPTIRHNLSTVLLKKGYIGAIRMEGSEDSDRKQVTEYKVCKNGKVRKVTICASRVRYFAVADATMPQD